MLARTSIITYLAASLLVACSTTPQLQINTDCQKYLSSRDIEEIRAIVMNRPDVRKPLWQITCEDRNHAVASSGPNNSGDISNYVSLARRHGRWHITSIKEGPVVVVTWITPRPNQAMQRTAGRSAARLKDELRIMKRKTFALASGG
jgi:hypothetical protein